MENYDAPSRDGHVDPSGDPISRLRPQLPELSLQMPDMRLAKLFEADILNHFQQADQPSPKLGW